jgi:chromosome partitioning protein
MDVNVSKAVDSFSPVVLSNPNTAGSKAFLQLGQEFMQKVTAMSRVNVAPSKVALGDL